MKQVKWGVIGAANIAFTQIVPAIRRSENGEVIAVASRDVEKAKKFNTVKTFDSYDNLLLDREIDAIYVPLPNALHKEWAIKAMDAKKHVLVEKPATLTVTDMEEMKEAANRNNVLLMEAFMYQFHPQHSYVKNLMASNIIGDFKHVKAHFSFYLEKMNSIKLNRELGGGALWDVGCYGVHALTQIVGMKPTQVTMLGKVDPKYQVDVTSVCFFTDEKNRTAEVTSSFEAPFLDRYEIFGEKGSIFVQSAFRPDVSEDGAGKIKVTDRGGHVIKSKSFKEDQYLKQIEHFQDCILHNKTPLYTVDQSIEVIKNIENAYHSLHNDSIVVKF